MPQLSYLWGASDIIGTKVTLNPKVNLFLAFFSQLWYLYNIVFILMKFYRTSWLVSWTASIIQKLLHTHINMIAWIWRMQIYLETARANYYLNFLNFCAIRLHQHACNPITSVRVQSDYTTCVTVLHNVNNSITHVV